MEPLLTGILMGTIIGFVMCCFIVASQETKRKEYIQNLEEALKRSRLKIRQLEQTVETLICLNKEIRS